MDLPPFPSTFNPFSPQHDQIIINQISPSISLIPQLQDNNNNLDDLLLQIPSIIQNNNDVINFPKQIRKASSIIDDEMNTNDKKKKQKIVHKEIERQRRFEMSSLHASLRSLLPHEYIKGKRAMSDHLGEAVKYIKYLQQNMKALNEQKEALKREVYLKTSKPRDRDVKIEACKGGLEVIVSNNCGVNNDHEEGVIPLSKVINCLIQEGLDVVTCISHRVDKFKLVHSIQTQVKDERKIDPTKLEQTLKDL